MYGFLYESSMSHSLLGFGMLCGRESKFTAALMKKADCP